MYYEVLGRAEFQHMYQKQYYIIEDPFSFLVGIRWRSTLGTS